MNRVMIWAVAGMMMLCSCAVKEDRGDCPCRMILDFSDNDDDVIGYAELFVSESGRNVLSDSIPSASFDVEYITEVPRGKLLLHSVFGDDGLWKCDSGLTISYGSQCPPLYLSCSVLEADGEMVRDRIVLHKEHCVISLYLVENGKTPCGLSIRGGVAGYGLDGKPVAGRFRCSDLPDSDGGCRMRVPRQVDNSLMLDIDAGTGKVRTFALGEYIASSGYDWNAPDLEDITVSIDYSSTLMSLTVQGWDEVHFFEIVI